MLKTPLAAVAVALSCAGVSLAQTAPAPANTSVVKHDKPLVPSNNNQAVSISQRMQSNGGSLLRATVESGAEPGQASLRNVSFMYVPSP